MQKFQVKSVPGIDVKRKLFGKNDLWLIGGVLALALFFYAINSFNLNRLYGLYGEVRLDGTVIFTMDLSADGEFSRLPGITFEVKNGAAAFTSSDCPDKICVNTGFINSPGQMAVCMPNRVSLTITGEEPR
jgi:hypothetical protein